VSCARVNRILCTPMLVLMTRRRACRGNTVDAMSHAVDGAEVVLFGVSLMYKESANCRLEANYAHQQEKDMIPLVRCAL
jgi:hypothetical protein